MRELKSVEEKILDRSLYLFGKNGSTNVPIRTIAKEANVNVGAINYYFGSKDEMIRTVQRFYIENTIAAYLPLDNDELNDEEKVVLCLNEIMEYSLRYPGVIVMHKEAVNAEVKDEMSNQIINITASMNEKLDKILIKVLDSSEEDFKYHRMIVLSSVLYPTSDKNILVFNEEFLKNKDGRINYIKYILKILKENTKIIEVI
ncbi:TetR/AcrR family transcriptional regulator [Clostridium neonatale]|uniref:TetR/AcrR family transcriptional regulator n=1 Tax=Clostridium neonatale TaxID=137838 RepID=UPI00291B4DF8|nr:TetR/AcrR family transcriptional regulator [Clostridium neonatale]CAI3212339.1 putative transcriptional regulator, TetR-like [Clostridium neonatale]